MVDVRSETAEFNLCHAALPVAVGFLAQLRLLFHGRIDPTGEPLAQEARLAMVEPPGR